MRAWEEREIERQKAFAEGEEAGIKTGKAVGITQGKNDLLKNLVKKKLEKNYSKEQIADMLGRRCTQPLKQLLTNYNS